MASSGLMKNILRVSNIPWTVSRHELALHFSQFGHVVDAFIRFDKKTGFHEGYGDVMFLNQKDMNAALDHKNFLEGKNLVLSKKYDDNKDGPNN